MSAVMRRVAISTVLVAAVAGAAALFVYERNATTIEQARAEHDEMVRHMMRMEELLQSVARNRTGQAAVPTPVLPVARGSSTPSAGEPGATPEAGTTPTERAAHEESVRSGNAFVDHIIASGHWNMSEMNNFLSATRGLSGGERGQMMARLAAAVNANQVRFDPSHHSP
jgi:hypothetical protein